MKAKLSPSLPVVLLMALPWSMVYGDWKVEPATRWSKEVRVWITAPNPELKFQWDGKTNDRNEAEGEGLLVWTRKNAIEGLVSRYNGTFKAGKREGKGTWNHSSGSKYTGEWKNNLKHGQGELWLDFGDYYKGEFREDKYEGKGVFIGLDGITYEGSFLAGKKNGNLRITYPDGTSRDSVWKDYVEVNAPPSKALQPYVLLGIDQLKYATGGEAEKADEGMCGSLAYRGKRENGNIVIEPDWDIWENWNKGGPIGSRFEAGGLKFEFTVLPVFLEVRVSNPGKTPLSIVNAEVEGNFSHPDPEPLLDIGDGDSGHGGLRCKVANFKRSQVKSCEIYYNVQAPTEEAKYGDYKFQESLAPFKESAEFRIGKAVDSLGIDSKAIALIDDPSSVPVGEGAESNGGTIAARQNAILAKVKAGLGPFAKHASIHKDGLSLHIRVTGEMKVGWDDHEGKPASRTVTFTFLKTLALLWPEYGAGAPSLGKFDITLPVNAKNYSKPFPFRKTIKPNSTGRFSLKLASDASTRHSFRVRLTTADGAKIVSPPCKLTYLLPANFTWKGGFVNDSE